MYFLRIFQVCDGSFLSEVFARHVVHDLLGLHGSNHVSKQIDMQSHSCSLQKFLARKPLERGESVSKGQEA